MLNRTIDLKRCSSHIYKNGKEQSRDCTTCYGTGFDMAAVLAAADLLNEIASLIEKKRPGDPLHKKIKVVLSSLNYR
jgi:hypothetical protein